MEKRRSSEKERNVENITTEDVKKNIKENNQTYYKRKKINIIKLFVWITIIAIVIIYGTRGIQLYLRDKAEKAEALETLNSYPQLRTLGTEEIIEINSMLENYFLGTSKDVVANDGFTNKEMIEFGINILSDKYSSSGIIPSNAMNLLISRYFNVNDIDYKSEGYSTLKTKTKAKTTNDFVYLFGKIKQVSKDSDIYEMEVHELKPENAKKEEYIEEDIISKKIITMKKINTTSADAKETTRYIFLNSND